MPSTIPGSGDRTVNKIVLAKPLPMWGSCYSDRATIGGWLNKPQSSYTEEFHGTETNKVDPCLCVLIWFYPQSISLGKKSKKQNQAFI